jgi:hypothetical protein
MGATACRTPVPTSPTARAASRHGAISRWIAAPIALNVAGFPFSVTGTGLPLLWPPVVNRILNSGGWYQRERSPLGEEAQPPRTAWLWGLWRAIAPSASRYRDGGSPRTAWRRQVASTDVVYGSPAAEPAGARCSPRS